MRLKWLFIALLLLLIINSCKKESTTPQVFYTKVPPANYLSVANVLQSNMVVQRDKPCLIWGLATPTASVVLTASWNSTLLTTKSDSKGYWQISIPSAEANANPQTITIASGTLKSIILNNILIGDVWICSGQSNMVYQVNVVAPFEGVVNYQAEIAAANYPEIRTLTLQADMEQNPVDSLTYPSQWNICSPQTAGNMSGVAYYFAQKLNASLNLPIGIIVSAVDGTSCEAWLNNAGFQTNPYLSSKYSGVNFATMYYNGMINPLIDLSIKGFICTRAKIINTIRR